MQIEGGWGGHKQERLARRRYRISNGGPLPNIYDKGDITVAEGSQVRAVLTHYIHKGDTGATAQVTWPLTVGARMDDRATWNGDNMNPRNPARSEDKQYLET